MNFEDLIGVPFQFGARGPEAYDCFGLTKEVLRRFGIYWDWDIEADELTEPVRAAISDAFTEGPWVPVDDRRVGDVVLMGANGKWSHIAPVVTAQGDLLHLSASTMGAVLLQPNKMRFYGFMRQQAYRWRG
jgi:hypothetical protein